MNTKLSSTSGSDERQDSNGSLFSLENFSLNNPVYSENKGGYQTNEQNFQPKYSTNKAFNPSNGYGGNFRKENEFGNGQINPFMNGDVNYNLYYQQQQGFYPKQPWVYNPSNFNNSGYNTYVDNSEKSSNGKYTCKFEIQIENDKEFQVARRIIGSKGFNMKRIVDICCQTNGIILDAVKLRLRGNGSGFKEGPNNRESDEPLHLCISSKYLDKYQLACNLVQELLLSIYEEYYNYCSKIWKIVPKLEVKKEEGLITSRKVHMPNSSQNINTVGDINSKL